MSYEKQTWTNGETITAEKLNHIEDGVEKSIKLIVLSTTWKSSSSSNSTSFDVNITNEQLNNIKELLISNTPIIFKVEYASPGQPENVKTSCYFNGYQFYYDGSYYSLDASANNITDRAQAGIEISTAHLTITTVSGYESSFIIERKYIN